MGLLRRTRKSSRKSVLNRNENTAKKKAAVAAEPVKAQETAAEETKAAEPVAAERKDFVKADASKVFDYFRQIAAIPHGSFHTKEISDFLVAFAKEHGLDYVQDESNNVIITKKASEGCEDAEPLALQGHIDMVLASEPDKEIDMLTEPVTILEEDGWMTADGTTLGADNGIAVAMMLAVLADESLVHPLIECIFTSDEEVGLIGASNIDLSGLKSRRLLNLDSEDEGVFCAGCAGGAEVVCEMPMKRKIREGRILNVRVAGLRGGHSGQDIHIGSANGNYILARALYRIFLQTPFNLISINGGDADNAIPTGSEARILFREDADTEKALDAFQKHAEVIAAEYKVTDPGMSWSAEWEEAENAGAVSKKNTRNILEYIIALPTGVTHMNPVIKEMPQTSLNLGIIRTHKNHLTLEFMVRSGVNSQNAYLAERVACITRGFGGKPVIRSSYPAWEFRKDSPFRSLAVQTYRDLTGEEPKVEVIHAGLECGILSGKLPELDCISAGPNLEHVHTVRERMNIASVENVWSFVLELLKAAAV